MNHALQNTILASAVAGVTLLFVLLAIRASAPEQMETRAGHYSGSAPAAERMASDLPTHLVVGLGIGAFSHALAGNGIAHGVPGSALVQASARVAESAVTATRARISGHFAPPAQPLPAAIGTQDLTAGDTPAANHHRGALAMPYFGTARALRPDTTGEAS